MNGLKNVTPCLNDIHYKGKQYLLSDSEEWEKDHDS